MPLAAAFLGGTSAVLLGLVGLVVGVAAAYGTSSIFRGARNQNLSQLQAGAVQALEGELTAQTTRADRLQDQCESLQRQVDGQRSEIETLRTLVTQAAKVDELSDTVKRNHGEVMAGIRTLGADQDAKT